MRYPSVQRHLRCAPLLEVYLVSFPGRGNTLLAILAACAAVLHPSPSFATQMRIVGGPGGRPFSATCQPGMYLAGFHARAGAWVDGLGLLCARYDASQNSLSKVHDNESYVGGIHGSPQEEYCPLGQPLTGIAMTFTRGNGLDRQYLNSLAMLCGGRDTSMPIAQGHQDRCISTGEDCDAFFESSTWGLTTRDRFADYQYCPLDEIAVGLQGRAGDYVDAIGLICAPAPAGGKASASTQVPHLPPMHPHPVGGRGNQWPHGGHGDGSHLSSGPILPQPPWAPKPTGTAIVTSDVDLYANPGGVGKPIGMLRTGTRVQAVRCRPDRWCQVGKQGWVWGDFLQSR